MRKMMVAAAVLGLVAAGGAQARDRTGYTAISAGDLKAAEATLDAERAIFPNRPEVLLNLAAIYARTARASEARAAYARVLASDDVMMELPDGSEASAHSLARLGSARLGASMASR